jgi:Restriction endonuclease
LRPPKPWQEYQSEAARLFQELGCETGLEKSIRGVRSSHKIDVSVRFKKFGLEVFWIIECKCWNSTVTKEKVLALKSVIEDVGADRGLLISKSGFQAGAIRAAEATNITLTDLGQIRELTSGDLQTALIQQLEKSATELRYALLELNSAERARHYRRGVLFPVDSLDVFHAVGVLSILQFGFDQVRLGRPPYPYTVSESGAGMNFTDSLEEFIGHAKEIVTKIETALDALRRHKASRLK